MITIPIHLKTTSYTIHIGHNSINDLPALPGDTILITDINIPETYIKKVSDIYHPIHTFILPAGETTKSIHIYQSIIEKMTTLSLRKSTTVIALGGGVIGDLAGFVASTYYRGIDIIQIPTTLLAMVDASIGGKVAINIHGHKNIIGGFHHPKAVYIDPNLLSTLPKRHMNNAYAEIIKMAMIKNSALFNALQDDTLSIQEIIEQSVLIKKYFVEKDEYDKHERHLLNYGHTLAHALESLHNYTYLHGECVAAGLRQMAKNKPFEQVLLKLLDKYELNISIPYDNETIINHIKHDKKISNTTLKLPYVEELGNGLIKTITIDDYKQML